jgi:lipid-A-disaccharide synthase
VPTAPTNSAPAVLFTAFEPSGDDHAAAVIAELCAMRPDVRILAWGGARMEAAGATIVERTGDDAVMGMPGLAKIREHQRINERIAVWLDANTPALHVPVDSPAANFPICELTKTRGVKVVHLVAPQIWAWGRWRIRKLRRLTNLVLCLLPFEEKFFEKRGVPALFIGHMLFDEPADQDSLERRSSPFPAGSPRLALMPGSRPDELAHHFPVLLGAFRKLRGERPGTVGIVAATTPAVEAVLRAMAIEHGGWPEGLGVVTGDTDAAIHWCDLALVKSGTVTLQVARQRRAMVIFYKKYNPFLFLLGRTVLATRVFSLPNLLAGRRIVPELIPHFGGPGPIVAAARKLLDSPELVRQQQQDLSAVCDMFRDRHAGRAGAEAIARELPAPVTRAEPVSATPSTASSRSGR